MYGGNIMIDVLLIIQKFIANMKYLENEHFLGMFFYGSFLTGYNNKNSDIDLHVIFDDSDFNLITTFIVPH